VDAMDLTPRAAVGVGAVSTDGTVRGGQGPHGGRGRPVDTVVANADDTTTSMTAIAAAATLDNTLGGGQPSSASHHHRNSDSGSILRLGRALESATASVSEQVPACATGLWAVGLWAPFVCTNATQFHCASAIRPFVRRH